MSFEELGNAMAQAAEAHGDHPLANSSAARSPRRSSSACSRRSSTTADLAACPTLLRRTSSPTGPMIEFVRTLRERGCDRSAHQQRARVGAALARQAAGDRRVFEVVDSAFVGMRKPEREIYELTLERLGAA